MRIVVMGSGGTGGYFGAKLVQSGHEVAFLARGAHLKAIQTNGLRVVGPLGDFTVKTPAAQFVMVRTWPAPFPLVISSTMLTRLFVLPLNVPVSDVLVADVI